MCVVNASCHLFVTEEQGKIRAGDLVVTRCLDSTSESRVIRMECSGLIPYVTYSLLSIFCVADYKLLFYLLSENSWVHLFQMLCGAAKVLLV